ncbi:hypothetical protein DYI37_01535 [Fulvimarina endophytica]|uniref:YaiO family outer membrane beta-barrel protein n=1 Tax=Fulvimarina endophytica TaxID=2293836 RepID=A0A371XAB5_9HYPH|nr:hypothetical protein [Fulvimarina endophytica]RFC66177.1 hypothetical protein DYI37_01535 [Fulvimarina endophytica]
MLRLPAISSLGILLLACSGLPTFAAAWLQDEGSGQIIATGLYSSANEAFLDRSGDTEPIDFEKGAATLLIDYGVRSWLTVSGTAEFGSESSDGLPFRRPGLSNASLFARTQLYRSDLYAMSVELGGRVEDAYGEADLEVDQFGWDAPLIEARWSGGGNFEVFGRASFVDLSAGYRYRLGEGPNEILLDASLGVRAFDRTTLLLQSFATIAEDSPEASYAYQKAQASVVYDLNETWSIQSGGFATIAGREALKERGAFAGLWYRF